MSTVTTPPRLFPSPTYQPTIAGQPVAMLAARHGTPLFVYDADRVAQRIEQLVDFDVVRYAQKACSTIGIVDLCRRRGCLVDAVSAGEIHRALTAGYAPRPASPGDAPPIVYTADVFDRSALAWVAQTGVHVNCGSIDMIGQYGALLADPPPGSAPLDRGITLRLNPGFGHGHSAKVNTGGPQSKHGIWHEDLELALERAADANLTVSGLHVHIGSGVDMEHLARVCGAVEYLAARVGPSLDTISGGGGLPVPYRPDDPELDVAAHLAHWRACRERLEETLDRPVRLEVEPGRFLVAEAGWLVTEVRAVKRQGDLRYVLVDAGFNDLARPVMYGAYHPVAVATDDERPAHPTVIAGPLCESGDVFTQGPGALVEPRVLPEVRVGDHLLLGVAGAYASSMGSNYNSRTLAAEVLIEDGAERVIRRRQPIEDLARLEWRPGA